MLYSTKLRLLVVRNWFVADSDSQQSKFDHWLGYKSNSKTTIKPTIAISINFWSLFDWSRSISNCFWFKDWKRLLECQLKDRKSQLKDWKNQFILKKLNLIKKVDFSDLSLIFYQSLFDLLSISLRSFINLFRSVSNFLIKFVVDLINFVATIYNPASNLDRKSQLKVNLIMKKLNLVI